MRTSDRGSHVNLPPAFIRAPSKDIMPWFASDLLLLVGDRQADFDDPTVDSCLGAECHASSKQTLDLTAILEAAGPERA